MEQTVSLLQILLLAQHVLGTIMSIIKSPRVFYRWLLPVVFGVLVLSCRSGIELWVVCPVCGMLHRTHSPQLYTRPTN